MINNFIKTLYSILVISFLIFVITTYFSQDNLIKVKKEILDVERKNKISINDLILLKNDTSNVIIYNTEDVINKKIKKRSIWELLK